ncbi:MAG: LCP family protein, partial [Lachnospiraceae bacterium]|nr:LCP family protein [Lachnospiraceae bacterium]
MSTQKKKKTSTGKIVLFVVEIVALIALLLVMWFVLKTTDSEKGVKRLELNESEIEVEFNESVKENEVMKGYRNIALFGVDSRNGDLANKTRTDTIIVASINEQTKEVKLVSVYRDTYLNQMGEKQNYGKCNAAYAYGGAEQAIKMLNANLDLDITDFVTIGFEGLRDVVDALGGVYIDVDAEEIKHLNNYQIAMVESMSDVSTYTPVTETGYQVLNGLQATAYCRIRYTAGNDFKRTERQREVIKACLETAKTVNPAALATMSQNVYSEVFTSFKLDDIISLLKDIASYSIVGEGGFPTEGK